MKLFYTILFICLCTITANAQKPTVALSAGFEENTTGWNKVLQLKNGNTFYFHFTPKEGIDVIVYGKDRKVIARKTITSTLWDAKKMMSSGMEGIYEIGGQPVIFLQQILERTPQLFRIKLNAQTGELDGEKMVASIPRYKTGAAWAMAYGGLPPNDFYVEKDPASDEYAIVSFNSFAEETNKRVELIHYGVINGKHKVLNRVYYKLPGGDYKYLNYVAMTLHNSVTYLCTYAYNSKWSANDAKLIISKSPAGSSSFTHQSLDFTEDFRSTKASLQYNTGTNLLQLMSLTLVNSKRNNNYYLALITLLDPQKLSMVTIKRLVGEKISEDMQRQMPGKDGYRGLPQKMIINADNSTTVLCEEMKMIETRSGYGAAISAQTTLGSVGVSEMNTKLDETAGNVVIKSQFCNGLFEPMYVSEKGKGKWSVSGKGLLSSNNAYMSFDYISTAGDRYIIFNDYNENFIKRHQPDQKRKSVNSISNANTFCYRLKDGTTSAFYLFGKPEENDTKFSNIESSNFDAATNTYATIMVEKTGGKKTAYIAWATFP